MLRSMSTIHSVYPFSDNILKIQNQLDETRDIMVQNIESILERGETIQELVDKTDDLEMSSKVFFQVRPLAVAEVLLSFLPSLLERRQVEFVLGTLHVSFVSSLSFRRIKKNTHFLLVGFCD